MLPARLERAVSPSGGARFGPAKLRERWWAEPESNRPLGIFSPALNLLSYQPLVVWRRGVEPLLPGSQPGASCRSASATVWETDPITRNRPRMAVQVGLEPTTPRLTGGRSGHWSY